MVSSGSRWFLNLRDSPCLAVTCSAWFSCGAEAERARATLMHRWPGLAAKILVIYQSGERPFSNPGGRGGTMSWRPSAALLAGLVIGLLLGWLAFR
jgi:hypothetical protein